MLDALFTRTLLEPRHVRQMYVCMYVCVCVHTHTHIHTRTHTHTHTHKRGFSMHTSHKNPSICVYLFE
jgi:hypothetical protein